MITLRESQSYNINLILIVFVVYGHLIASQICQNNCLVTRYRWFGFIDMPLFLWLIYQFFQWHVSEGRD